MSISRLHDADLYRTYCNWRQGSGPFRCFMRSTNFVTLQHYEDFSLLPGPETPDFRGIEQYVGVAHASVPIILLEMAGSRAIRCAWHLQNTMAIKPVLTFNNILHPLGLVGDREYISALIHCGNLLKPVEPERYAFILDSQRFGEYDDDQYRKFFNNQYELTEDDLPAAEMLMALNCHEVLLLHEEEMKEDLQKYLEYLVTQEIGVLTEKIQGDIL